MSDAFFLTTLGRVIQGGGPRYKGDGYGTQLAPGEKIARHVARWERRLMGRAARRARIKAQRAAWKAAHAARFPQVVA